MCPDKLLRCHASSGELFTPVLINAPSTTSSAISTKRMLKFKKGKDQSVTCSATKSTECIANC